MYLDRRHRKLILLKSAILRFYSEKETFPKNLKEFSYLTDGKWVSGENDKTDKGNIFYIVSQNGEAQHHKKISVENMETHLRGGDILNTEKTYDNFCLELFGNRFETFEKPFSDPNKQLGVFTFGEKMGIDRSTSRFLIDNHYANYFPTYGSFADTAKPTTDFVLQNGGVYSLYRFDNNRKTQSLGYSSGIVTVSRMSIRYPVPYKGDTATGREKFRIRTKLNVPKYLSYDDFLNGEKPDFFKYDGYVSQNGSKWWQWLLQCRKLPHKKGDEDLILLYTSNDAELLDNYQLRTGKILYQDQSSALEPTLNNIMLVTHNGYEVIKDNLPDYMKYTIFNQSALSNKVKSRFDMIPGERKHMRDPYFIDPLNIKSWNPIDELVVPRLMANQYS